MQENKMKQQTFFIQNPYKIFVKKLTPDKIKSKYPLVLMPGSSHSSTIYEKTPDGRNGWVDYFLKQGFEIYLVDWGNINENISKEEFDKVKGISIVNSLIKLIEKIGPCILFSHSMSGGYGWIVGEKISKNVKAIIGIAPTKPGNILSEQAVSQLTIS